MAALETIRKRAVILTIVIGAGLLAFILEEGVRASSSFFNDTTAAQVGDAKIELQEFNRRYEELTQNQKDQQNRQDAAVQQQQLLNQMEMETILDQEYEATGIDVSSEEMAVLMNNDQQANQMTRTVAEQLGQAIQSPSQLDKLVESDPQRFQLVAGPWGQMKKQVYDQMRGYKLYYLVSNAIVPNDLDRLAMEEDNASTYSIEFAKKDFATLDDAKYKPSQSEIESVYNQYKELWKVNDPQRRIHYIALNILPSAKDLAAGKAAVAKAQAAIAGPNGLDSLKNISEFSNVQTQKVTADQAKQIGQQTGDSALYKFITGSAVGASHMFNQGYDYALYKLKAIEQLTDTAKIVMVGVQGNKAQQDKVLAALNAGQDVSKMKGVEVQPEQAIQVQNPQYGFNDTIKSKIENATDQYFVLNSDAKQGAVLMKVASKVKKTFYTLGISTYSIVASTETANAAQDRLENFLAKNRTAAAFVKNAVKGGFAMNEAFISSATSQLENPMQRGSGIENSRKAIKWAMTEAKAGDVSSVFADNHDVLLAIAVDEVYDGDYMPMNSEEVLKFCTTKAMNIKKAKAMEEQFKGKASNVAGYAKLFGTATDTTQVMFGSDQVFKINTMPLSGDGNEGDAAIIGRVATAKQGAVQFYVGNSAVYAFVVTKVEKSKMKLKKEDLNNRWLMQYGIYDNPQMGTSRFSSVVMGSAKIKNNLVKFQ